MGGLNSLFSGRTCAQIANIEVEAVFGRLGLKENLSPNRRGRLRYG